MNYMHYLLRTNLRSNKSFYPCYKKASIKFLDNVNNFPVVTELECGKAGTEIYVCL